MELGSIRPGVRFQIVHIPDGQFKERLCQFGMVEGTVVGCRYARRTIVALEWKGTAVAIRRKDLRGIESRVVPWES